MDMLLREVVSRADVKIWGQTVPRQTELGSVSTGGEGKDVGVPNASEGTVAGGRAIEVDEVVFSPSVCARVCLLGV